MFSSLRIFFPVIVSAVSFCFVLKNSRGKEAHGIGALSREKGGLEGCLCRAKTLHESLAFFRGLQRFFDPFQGAFSFSLCCIRVRRAV